MQSFVSCIKGSNYTLEGKTSRNIHDEPGFSEQNSIGNVLIAKQIAEDEISHLLDVTVKEESLYQSEILLSILASAEFSDEYIRLHETF